MSSAHYFMQTYLIEILIETYWPSFKKFRKTNNISWTKNDISMSLTLLNLNFFIFICTFYYTILLPGNRGWQYQLYLTRTMPTYLSCCFMVYCQPDLAFPMFSISDSLHLETQSASITKLLLGPETWDTGKFSCNYSREYDWADTI